MRDFASAGAKNDIGAENDTCWEQEMTLGADNDTCREQKTTSEHSLEQKNDIGAENDIAGSRKRHRNKVGSKKRFIKNADCNGDFVDFYPFRKKWNIVL